MFVDEVEVEVRAGDGGAGAVAFRKEKFVPHGGPSGGDGGRGGSVILQADAGINTLIDFRGRRHLAAQRGADGGAKNMYGKDGADLVLTVPVGTIAVDLNTGAPAADLDRPGERAVVARGGAGGRGNARFATPIAQAPRHAEKGEPGERRRLRLELKLLADVGLVGFPNVGKSTLIAAVSAARPRIADYPFTTLTPSLGVVSLEPGRSFVMADIPGLIEGAGHGAGLGHRFLRHVERTSLLVHILDVSGMTGRDPVRDLDVLNHELGQYNARLAALPQIVALNKIDVAETRAISLVSEALRDRGIAAHPISASTGAGLGSLLAEIWRGLERLRAAAPRPFEADREATRATTARADERASRLWVARRVDASTFEVTGRSIERRVAMTDLANAEAVRRLQRFLDRIGVTKRLRSLGTTGGDTVRIGDSEFEFLEDDLLEAVDAPTGRTGRGSRAKGN